MVASLLDYARVIIYDLSLATIVVNSFIVLATVIKIVNYYHTVFTILNCNFKTFIVQATEDTGKGAPFFR